ncbi:WW domain-binding protein 2-like [Styela clava]|uniref:WW domain-binding protein 2-like n=1 Tax=Styela clava TaxID=7725 RepID=UPI00193A09DF|nr:WW domain-binding protein 2-like [Styela clava]
MSINRSAGLQLFQGELTVQQHKDVELKFKKVKYSSEHLKGSKVGQLYLTNFRAFFVNSKTNDMLQNFSMPFKLIKDFEIKQPVFGANHLEGKIMAEEGGGWQGSAEFEMTFKAGGAIEVGESLIKMAKNPRMMYIAQPAPIIVTGVPQGMPIQPGYAPPPMGYQPTAPPLYSQYPTQPPYNQGPPIPPYPAEPSYQPTDPKSQEAMASGSSYLPPGYSAPAQNPPSYYDTTKKDQ